ncbi:beta-galactosidase [Candidatus Uhrbacteria bacterium]|nr:beta-galactosidase [Candidatus Uhrbacteria bacterium]
MFWCWIKRVVLVVVAVVLVIAAYLFIPVKIAPAEHVVWGTTFTKSYAQYLGLDWRQTYLAILDDLGVKSVRIGINWDEIEPEPGRFDFTDYDWMFDEAEKRGVEIVPAVGFKLPRWPECRAPEFARVWLPERSTLFARMFDIRVGPQREKFEEAQLNMMREVIEHFKSRKSIKVWQVENEGFIGWFGDCPPIKNSFVRREVEFVRALDPTRPILMTESGELSTGIKSALAADIVGTSLYREVWNAPLKKFTTYPLPPSFYAHKARLLKPWVKEFQISELQLEAWTREGILNAPIEEQLERISPEKMRAAINYARRTGIDEIYAWGAEWWWWLKINGYPQLWEVAREEFAK